MRVAMARRLCANASDKESIWPGRREEFAAGTLWVVTLGTTCVEAERVGRLALAALPGVCRSFGL